MEQVQVRIKNRLTGKDDRLGDILPYEMDGHTAIRILRNKKEGVYYAEDIIDVLTKILNKVA